jgi:hypothetical protein
MLRGRFSMAASTTIRTQPSQQPVQATDLRATTSRLAEVPANMLSADVTEAIRVRAYELWEKRGRQHGSDAEDWLEAEAEILSHRSHDAWV